MASRSVIIFLSRRARSSHDADLHHRAFDARARGVRPAPARPSGWSGGRRPDAPRFAPSAVVQPGVPWPRATGTRAPVCPSPAAGWTPSALRRKSERGLARRGLSRLCGPHGQRRVQGRPRGAAGAGRETNDRRDVRRRTVVAMPPPPGVRRAHTARVGGHAHRSRRARHGP